jgi:hypothetical protein
MLSRRAKSFLGPYVTLVNMCLASVILCPEGAVGLSPGFQPWEPTPKRGALKGRQIGRTNYTKVRCYCDMSQLLTPLAPSGATLLAV